MIDLQDKNICPALEEIIDAAGYYYRHIAAHIPYAGSGKSSK